MTQALPTGLSLATINTPPTALQWNDAELAVAGQLGLPTTTFEPGGVELVIFSVVANMMTQADIAGSIAIQAGFLNFAAFGTVTWTDATGASQTIFVTPDPSLPAQNPAGGLGWLDVLADGAYNVQRILQAPAGGTLAILNTQTTYGPFAGGTFTASNPSAVGAPTYTNTGILTIPQSATLGVVTGSANSGGAVKLSATGTWTVGQVVFVAGVLGTIEANDAWTVLATDGTTYVTLAGSTFANAWTSGGTIYAPTLASFQATTSGTGSNAGAHQVDHPMTSLIGVTVDNYAAWLGTNTEGNVSLANRCRLKLGSLSVAGPTFAYLSFALAAQLYTPTLNPPLTGRPGTPITRAISAIDITTGTVTTTIANDVGAPSGTSYPPNPLVDDGTDVYAVGSVIQAYVVPLGTKSIVRAATPLSITVAITAYVPIASVSAAQSVIALAVPTYFAAVPIGGVVDPGGPQNVFPIQGMLDAVAVALAASSITVQDMAATLNGTAANVSMGAALVATLTTPFGVGFGVTVVGY